MKLYQVTALSSAASFMAGLIVCWNLKASVDRQDISEIKLRLDQSTRESSNANHDTKRILDKMESCQVLISELDSKLSLTVDRAVQAAQSSVPLDPSIIATPEEIRIQDEKTKAGAKKR